MQKCSYLETVGVCFDSLFLQISNESMAEPGAHQVSQEKQVYKHPFKKKKKNRFITREMKSIAENEIMVPCANKIVPRNMIPGCFISRAVIKCILSFSASSTRQTKCFTFSLYCDEKCAVKDYSCVTYRCVTERNFIS